MSASIEPTKCAETMPPAGSFGGKQSRVVSVMGDGKALFHAGHKNLAASGTALDVANLGQARSAMARQVGLDGKTILNIRPAYLVVPSTLELDAEQIIAQNLVPAKTGDVVPNSIRSLAVIAEPRLDPVSGAVPWYPLQQHQSHSRLRVFSGPFGA